MVAFQVSVRLPTAHCCAAARARVHGCHSMLSVHVELLARAAWLRIHARHVLIPRISLVFTCRAPSLCSQDQHDGVQTDVEALLHVCLHIAAAAQLRGALADCSLLRCGARARTAVDKTAGLYERQHTSAYVSIRRRGQEPSPGIETAA